MTPEITIAHCDYSKPEHVKAVTALLNAYIEDEMGGGEPLTQPQQIRLIDGLKLHPMSIVLLAEQQGIFTGLLVAFENFSTFTVKPMLNIHDVVVLKTHRGIGVGRKLLQAIVREAEIRGCSRLSLEVRNDNMVAQSLYRSLGFNDTNPPMFYWRKYVENVEN
jgi:GNAT superfamily N-acetyltransferase